jgi:N-acetyl-anhydromuramyl-L-alanine amidase AmpD
VLHYTVSPNRVGWSDVNAVVAEFANPAFQASSNYVIDGEGHCAYIVRESDKAWTQAAANPFAISPR